MGKLFVYDGSAWTEIAKNGTDGADAAWGMITGTLANQTDLKTALDGKLPTSATTAQVPDSNDRRYVTNALLAVLQNTSGVNTGDQSADDLPGLVDKINDLIEAANLVVSVNGETGTVTLSAADVGADASGAAATAQSAANAYTDGKVAAIDFPVDSVNGEVGAVVLDQDDIGDGSTYKRFSATERTKLQGIAPAATANSTDAYLLSRANHTGTQPISTVIDLQAFITPRTGVISLTDGPTISTDASAGSVFAVTLGGNRTFDTPTNLEPGRRIIYRIRQDATGSRTATWGAGFRFSTDIPAPVLSTTGGKLDYVAFIYNMADSVLDCIGYVRGF